MYTRYMVRNTCFGMKKGKSLSEDRKEIVKEIEKQLKKKKYSWSNFSKLWDVFVTKDKINVVTIINDMNIIRSVCDQKKMVEEYNIKDKVWTEQESNVIELIEVQFLQGKMEWKNYGKNWTVEFNRETNRVETKLRSAPAQDMELVDQLLKEQMSSHKKEEAEEE